MIESSCSPALLRPPLTNVPKCHLHRAVKPPRDGDSPSPILIRKPQLTPKTKANAPLPISHLDFPVPPHQPLETPLSTSATEQYPPASHRNEGFGIPAASHRNEGFGTPAASHRNEGLGPHCPGSSPEPSSPGCSQTPPLPPTHPSLSSCCSSEGLNRHREDSVLSISWNKIGLEAGRADN